VGRPQRALGLYDRVVLRSVFDYQHRVDEFLAWCRAVGPRRLRNSPDLVEFSADRRYLCDLSLPTLPTAFVASGDPQAEHLGRRARHRPLQPGDARGGQGADRVHPRQRWRRARPAVPVEHRPTRRDGARVFRRQLSYVLRKRALLYPDEVAPMAREGLGFQLGVAQAMFEEDLHDDVSRRSRRIRCGGASELTHRRSEELDLVLPLRLA
jgi:hypothetical protein